MAGEDKAPCFCFVAGSYLTGVLAWYLDEKTGKESKVTAGDQTRPKRLTPLYTSKAAERVLEKEWKSLQAN